MVNTTGYSLLFEGKIVESAYAMYNASFFGNFLLVVFVTLHLALLIKTKNAGLSFGIGIIFFAMFYAYLSPLSITVMISILVFELAGTMYQSLFKN